MPDLAVNLANSQALENERQDATTGGRSSYERIELFVFLNSFSVGFILVHYSLSRY